MTNQRWSGNAKRKPITFIPVKENSLSTYRTIFPQIKLISNICLNKAVEFSRNVVRGTLFFTGSPTISKNVEGLHLSLSPILEMMFYSYREKTYIKQIFPLCFRIIYDYSLIFGHKKVFCVTQNSYT